MKLLLFGRLLLGLLPLGLLLPGLLPFRLSPLGLLPPGFPPPHGRGFLGRKTPVAGLWIVGLLVARLPVAGLWVVGVSVRNFVFCCDLFSNSVSETGCCFGTDVLSVNNFVQF